MTGPSMRPRSGGNRVLIYSHDTFGLGHLRRARAIAHALVDRDPDLSVLIISGSPVVGGFEFKNGVDVARIPGVVKTRAGDYVPLGLNIPMDEVLGIRSALIRRVAEVFRPDLLIVDKEPLGLAGEALDALEHLSALGVPTVLGVRDVLDDSGALAAEWERKNVLPALERLYDEIWVYGPPGVLDPFQGLSLPACVRDKVVHTGYLRRETENEEPRATTTPAEPFLLVTPGGGGDGEPLVDWVLRAYEVAGGRLPRALIVFGPFMRADARAAFEARAERLGGLVDTVVFEPRMEAVTRRASWIAAMGGYNTFCEILSFDKPALIVPRTVPRREQIIRAERFSDMGLISMLVEDENRDPAAMVDALSRLVVQPPPSAARVGGLLDGLPAVGRAARRLLDDFARRVGRNVA